MNEDKYCLGCGIKLQDENVLLDGYTASLSNDLCARCFRLKNYGEYKVSNKNNEEYINILKEVNETKDLVLYVVDLLNIEKDIKSIRNYISNHMILVVTKRDVIPKSIKDEKLLDYFKKQGLDYIDSIIISSKKNYNFDPLLRLIKKDKSSKNVYVVGYTNRGKSALINRLVDNYGIDESKLTVSPLPSTTLNTVKINLTDDITLIDTPGLIDSGNITSYIDSDMLKKINPKKEIRPITYQIKPFESILVDNILRVEYKSEERNSFTFFMSNDLKLKKVVTSKNEELKELNNRIIEVGYNEDLVIDGLGFIKITEKCIVSIYINKDVDVFVRESLI